MLKIKRHSIDMSFNRFIFKKETKIHKSLIVLMIEAKEVFIEIFADTV